MKKRPISEQKIKQNRTEGTAREIIYLMQHVSLTDLVSDMYIETADVLAKKLTFQYESQLILAHEKPTTFSQHLHKFYQEMARKIKKEFGYQTFFLFVISSIPHCRFAKKKKKVRTFHIIMY
jgi:hypothetical protein